MCLESVKKALGEGWESYEKAQESVEKTMGKLEIMLKNCWKAVVGL